MSPSTTSSSSPSLIATSQTLLSNTLSTSLPIVSQLYSAARSALNESANPYLTLGGLLCISSSVLNSIFGELWILRPLLNSIDTTESQGSFWGLPGKRDSKESSTGKADARTVMLLEKNARAIRVAYHLFSTLLLGLGSLLLTLGRPSTNPTKRDRTILKTLTGTFTVSAILITLLGPGRGALRTPAFPAMGPVAVLMALAMARNDRVGES